MDKKQHRKRKKVKRLVIAYLLRAVVILIPVIMIILMVCGCLYIYEKFTKEDEKTDICTDIYIPIHIQMRTLAMALLLLLQQLTAFQSFASS